MLTSMRSQVSDVERFHHSWLKIEQYLRRKYRSDRRGMDTEAQLRAASADGTLTRRQEEFLDACRRLRNALSHVTFDTYEGPVALPPRPVVDRLERIVRHIEGGLRIGEVAKPAFTCSGDDPLGPVVPTALSADARVIEAMELLEQAADTRVPAIVVDKGPTDECGVLTAWDLPVLYRQLGR